MTVFKAVTCSKLGNIEVPMFVAPYTLSPKFNSAALMPVGDFAGVWAGEGGYYPGANNVLIQRFTPYEVYTYECNPVAAYGVQGWGYGSPRILEDKWVGFNPTLGLGGGVQQGSCVLGLDHPTTNGVTLEYGNFAGTILSEGGGSGVILDFMDNPPGDANFPHILTRRYVGWDTALNIGGNYGRLYIYDPLASPITGQITEIGYMSSLNGQQWGTDGSVMSDLKGNIYSTSVDSAHTPYPTRGNFGQPDLQTFNVPTFDDTELDDIFTQNGTGSYNLTSNLTGSSFRGWLWCAWTGTRIRFILIRLDGTGYYEILPRYGSSIGGFSWDVNATSAMIDLNGILYIVTGSNVATNAGQWFPLGFDVPFNLNPIALPCWNPCLPIPIGVSTL